MRLLLEQVLNKYQSNVYKVAFYVLGNPQDAEDVAQEAFLAYHSELKDFENEDHIRAWLLKVAVNKARNLRGSSWHRSRVDVPDFTEWLEARAEEHRDTYGFDSEELLKAVMSLPYKCRIAVHLFYYEDYSIKEIAEVLDVRESTVKSQLHRGRELLREMLKEKWENE